MRAREVNLRSYTTEELQRKRREAHHLIDQISGLLHTREHRAQVRKEGFPTAVEKRLRLETQRACKAFLRGVRAEKYNLTNCYYLRYPSQIGFKRLPLPGADRANCKPGEGLVVFTTKPVWDGESLFTDTGQINKHTWRKVRRLVWHEILHFAVPSHNRVFKQFMKRCPVKEPEIISYTEVYRRRKLSEEARARLRERFLANLQKGGGV